MITWTPRSKGDTVRGPGEEFCSSAAHAGALVPSDGGNGWMKSGNKAGSQACLHEFQGEAGLSLAPEFCIL